MPRKKIALNKALKRKVGEPNEAEPAKNIEDGPNSKYFKLKKTTDRSEKECSKQRLSFSFYDQQCEDLAKTLLGKKIVRKLQTGEILSGVIVETEAYLGGEDKASHSYNGKRTTKTEAMYMPPGTAYVYHIYGTYTCLNISSRGDGAAVLVRGLDPIDGIESMKKFRGTKRADKGKDMKDKDVGSGPSKLTQALSIDKAGINKQDLTIFSDLWLQDGPSVIQDEEIITSARIGVDYAEEWAKKPLRFYILGNKSVSVKDKQAETEKKKGAMPSSSKSVQ